MEISISVPKLGKPKDVVYVDVNIPDDIVEAYARETFSLMTYEEAIQDYEPEPPEYDEP